MKTRHLFATAAAVMALCAPAFASDAPQFGTWGVETKNFSTTIRPGDDFYAYVNEGWLKTAVIPQGLTSYDDPTRIYLANEQRVGAIINDLLGEAHARNSPEQQIADAYRAFSDQARLDALGMKPILPDLALLNQARTHAQLFHLMTQPGQGGVVVGGVIADPANPKSNLAALQQGPLTLPARDYYLGDGEPYATMRKLLRDYMAATFKRGGFDDAEGRADRTLAFEIEVARRQWPLDRLRDQEKMYHPMTLAELDRYAPGVGWKSFLAGLGGLDVSPKINVRTDSAIKDIVALTLATPVDTVRDYMRFSLLDGAAPLLSSEWQEANFDFHSRKLLGIKVRRPALQRAIASTNGLVGEQIGRIYVARHFPESYRAQVSEMIGYMRSAFHDRIAALPWMDDATRAEAQAKLAKVSQHIGFPEKWHDYASIVIRPDDLFGNVRRKEAWSRTDQRAQLLEGRRDWEWPYHPQEVNAGYMASLNSITFPAGFLQPPYFDPKADAAVNFGAIAAVIGHEFGHGFDDSGSQSDGDGRLRNWWTDASRAEFNKRTAGLIEQYNQYEPVPGTHINGKQNLGENIGDLGGLSIAYDAYRRYVADKLGGQDKVIDGLSGDQRYFLSWGQVWRNVTVPEELRRQALSDNHSANPFRVNGVVRNIDAWYDAFGVKPGDKLYLPPDQRVKIW